MKQSNIVIAISMLLVSCSVSKQISKQATNIILKDSAVNTGHIGISIYEPATNAYWYNHDATKYFVPASNVKLFTLYAGLKYLGDSLTGLWYQNFSDTAIYVIPTGDPSFLHKDFKQQPVLDFLQHQTKKIYVNTHGRNAPQALGTGWAWDDYNDDYMAERNAFPIYGNLADFRLGKSSPTSLYSTNLDWQVLPVLFNDSINNFYLQPAQVRLTRPVDSTAASARNLEFSIKRKQQSNWFMLEPDDAIFGNQAIPFFTNGINTTINILKHDLHIDIRAGSLLDNALYGSIPAHLQWHRIYSQPVDSLFKPMMHRSDNFFAEQTLLMVSDEVLGGMDERKMIDTLLRRNLLDIPQRPKWVDGSGLSRYNLFTPQSFIYILNKMKDEFGLVRLKQLLPTGGKGTLSAYYKKDAGYIFAKTGTLSNHCALSGFIITKKNKLLIFSVLANNYQTSATPVRRAVEKFLTAIRDKY